MKNKKPIIFIMLLVVLGMVVGGTLAYYTTTDTYENEFVAGKYDIETIEAFVSPENWTPGTTTPKTVIATNKGNTMAAVRVKLTPSWVDANGDPLPLTDGNDELAAIINFASDVNTKWVYENGYYYYVYPVKEGQSTSTLIESVTFNPDVEMDQNRTCNTVNGQTSCRISFSDYAGGTYTLEVEVDTVQSDQYKNIWNTNVELIQQTAAQELLSTGSLVNTAGANRFVGNPNNYIYVNGEKWRIIGVYDGRLKIINLDNPILNQAVDTDQNATEWEGSNLQEYLNGTYYDNLADEFKNIIDVGTWYIGGSNYHYSAVNAYNYAITNTWTGKVGLMATYEFLYSSNDENCYSSVSAYSYRSCMDNGKGWLIPIIYKSWTLTRSDQDKRMNYVSNGMYVYDDVMTNSENSSASPAVYLKSTVKFAGGNGTFETPYRILVEGN